VTIWRVLADADRERWDYLPSVGIGPLRFGMSPTEAAAVLPDFTAVSTPERAEFRRAAPPPWSRGAVTAYFGEGLYCVAIDAQSGPQVVLDGISLVGRAPSQVEAQLVERHTSLRYQPEGDPVVEELGLMMRAQRVGDVVLTRPVLAVLGERARTLWDTVPGDELDVH
jgi:hypothetical protein